MSELDGNRFLYMPRFLLGRWLDIAACFLGVLAIFATIVLSLRLINFHTDPMRMALASGVTSLVCVCLYVLRNGLSSRLEKFYHRAATIPLLWIFLFSILIRLIWIVFFPAQPGSDGAVYMSLASRLRDFEEYEIAQTRAYWPPGYPLILAVWQTIFPIGIWIYWSLNLLLFSIMFMGVVVLTRMLASDKAAKISAFLLAVWPNFVTSVATPEKELVVAAILPWILVAIVSILMGAKKPVYLALGSGLLMGICILVQPSIQLLIPVVAILLILARQQTIPKKAAVISMIVIGAAVIVSPWTYRNYQVFDTFLLVSSNGGSNLYRANNPLATGGYTEVGEVDLSELDELAQDREGKRLAKVWIKENPADFAKLIPEKQIRFMGDDATGIYTALKVGGASDNESLYAILKLIANSWWMFAWGVVIFAVAIMGVRAINPLARLMLWLWLFFFVIHSIFESAGKYHIPALWVLPCLMATYIDAIYRVKSERK